MAGIVSIDRIGHGSRSTPRAGRELAVAYRVVTDDAETDGRALLEAAWLADVGGDSPLPSLWEQLGGGPDMWATDFRVEETGRPGCRIVTVVYKPAPGPWGGPGAAA